MRQRTKEKGKGQDLCVSLLIAQHFIIGRIFSFSLYIIDDIVMSLNDEHYEQIQ